MLECLQKHGIAHRDLKPENLLIDSKNHLKLIDFGTAFFFNTNYIKPEVLEKLLKLKNEELKEEFEEYSGSETRQTFVGTIEYVSPELLFNEPVSYPVDIWALGCTIYKMFTGKTPFYDKTEYLVYEKIKAVNYSLTEVFNIKKDIPELAIDLIKKIFVLAPFERLGAGLPGTQKTITHMKDHPFFQGIDFDNLPYSKGLNFECSFLRVVHNDKESFSEFSDSGDILLKSIMLKRKRIFFYKQRLLILYSNGMFDYIQPERNMRLKARVNLKETNAKVELKGNDSFMFWFNDEKMFFKDYETSSIEWVTQLSKFLK